MEVVLFVPGFFGFGEFGPADRPLVEYFARVEDTLLKAHARPLHFSVHQPPPAGSLLERARSLHLKAAELLRGGATRIHLVGHSTGGVDARLLANPRYGGVPARGELLEKLASVITISAPFRGTPLARRTGRGAFFLMPALWFGSILASRGRLRLAGHAAALFNLAKRATLQQPTPTDQLIAQLAGVDQDTAHQIKRFLTEVARDHRLIEDLTPEAMLELNRSLEGGDPRLESFVSVSPRPGFSPFKFLAAPLQRTLYDLTWALTADPPRDGAPVPRGPWLGARRIALTDTTNDGIVPAWSQTLRGEAQGIVLGDHLDVIGHYESVGATFLRSGSDFDDARFRALWSQVAHCLRER